MNARVNIYLALHFSIYFVYRGQSLKSRVMKLAYDEMVENAVLRSQRIS